MILSMSKLITALRPYFLSKQTDNVVQGDLTSQNYAEGLAGWGIFTPEGNAEFNDIVARGAFTANTFVMNEYQISTGTHIVAGGGRLRTAATTAATFYVDIEDPISGHGTIAAVNDIVRFKSWSAGSLLDIWGTVVSVGDQTTFYTYGISLQSGSTGVVIPKGSLMLVYGLAGEGHIMLTADQADAPFLSVQTIDTSAPWTNGISEQVRIGRLDGLSLSEITANEPDVFGLVAGTDLRDTSAGAQYVAITNAGVYLRNVLLSMYNSSVQTVSLSSSGTLLLGSNIASAATTGFNFNGPSGDLRIGRSDGNNAFWDQSEGTLTITGGVVANGSLTAVDISGSSITAGTISGAAISAGSISGTTITGGTITGTTVRTAASGARVEMSGTEIFGTDGTTVQWFANSGGIGVGQGTVYLNEDGISLSPGNSVYNRISWYNDLGFLTARISALVDTGQQEIHVAATQVGGSDTVISGIEAAKGTGEYLAAVGAYFDGGSHSFLRAYNSGTNALAAFVDVGYQGGVGTIEISPGIGGVVSFTHGLAVSDDILANAANIDIGSSSQPFRTIYVDSIETDAVTGAISGPSWTHNGNMTINAESGSNTTLTVSNTGAGSVSLAVESITLTTNSISNSGSGLAIGAGAYPVEINRWSTGHVTLAGGGGAVAIGEGAGIEASLTVYNISFPFGPLIYARQTSGDPTGQDFYRWYSGYGPVEGGIRATAPSAWMTQIWSTQGMAFATNGAGNNRLFINADGTVGIGSIGGGHALGIVRSASTTSILSVRNSSYTSANSSGTVGIDLGWSDHAFRAIEAKKDTINTSMLNLYSEYGYSTSNLVATMSYSRQVFYTGGLERLRITSGGYIGINEATPTYRFQVKGSDSGISNTSSDWVSGSAGTVLNLAVAASTGNSYGIIHALSHGGGQYAPISLARDGGSVGVGIAAPNAKLHVNGDFRVTNPLALTPPIMYISTAYSGVGINREPDGQFALDVEGPLRASYLIGPHAIQLSDAELICHFDGAGPFETNYTGTPQGHKGQVATVTGDVIYRSGKFGKAVQVARATTNLWTNPSVETNLTGYNDNAGGTTRTRDATYSVYGDYSQRVVCDGTGSGQGWYTNVVAVTAGIDYVASVYIRGSGTVTVALFQNPGAVLVDSETVALTNEWQRIIVGGTLSVAATDVSLFVGTSSAQAVTYWTDGVQIEQSVYATPYHDGSLTTPTSWTGTAHASTSTRTAGTLLHGIGEVSADAGTIMMWVYTDSFSADGSTLWNLGNAIGEFSAFILSGTLYFQQNSTLIAYDVSALRSAWFHAAFTWNVATSEYVLYVNGVERTSGAYSAVVLDTDIGIGYSRHAGTTYNHLGVIDDFVVLSRVAEPDEIKSIYTSNAPVFAESSTSFVRTYGPVPMEANQDGLFVTGSTTGAILGVYGGSSSKVWGGVTLYEGDILIGRASGGYLRWDDSASLLDIAAQVNLTGISTITGLLRINTNVPGQYIRAYNVSNEALGDSFLLTSSGFYVGSGFNLTDELPWPTLAIAFASQGFGTSPGNFTMGAGDVFIGDGSGGSNVLWDEDVSQLQFRYGTTVKALIDSSGNFVSIGSSFKINADMSTNRGQIYYSNPLTSDILNSTGIGIITSGTLATESIGLRAIATSGRVAESYINAASSGQAGFYLSDAGGQSKLHMTTSEMTFAVGNTTPDMTLSSAGVLTLAGSILLDELGEDQEGPINGAQARLYMINNRFVVQYNHAGTVKYWYLELTGTSGTWTYSTTAP